MEKTNTIATSPFMRWRLVRATLLLSGIFAGILAGLGGVPMHSANAEETAAASTGLVGWLDITPQADPDGNSLRLAIAGRAFALAGVNGRYTLDVRRRGTGGVSNSRQSGAFSVAPSGTAVLSRTTINAQKADTLEIELKLFVGEAEVFAVTMRPAVPAASASPSSATPPAGGRTL